MKRNDYKPTIFSFSFTEYPRYICRVVLSKVDDDTFWAMPEKYMWAYGQGSTRQEAYANWLLDLSNEDYE